MTETYVLNDFQRNKFGVMFQLGGFALDHQGFVSKLCREPGTSLEQNFNVCRP